MRTGQGRFYSSLRRARLVAALLPSDRAHSIKCTEANGEPQKQPFTWKLARTQVVLVSARCALTIQMSIAIGDGQS